MVISLSKRIIEMTPNRELFQDGNLVIVKKGECSTAYNAKFIAGIAVNREMISISFSGLAEDAAFKMESVEEATKLYNAFLAAMRE
jgi:hypothetical protein